MVRRAITFIRANYPADAEVAINDALAGLALRDAQDVRLGMHINIAVQIPYLVSINYITDEPWVPAHPEEHADPEPMSV